MPALKHPVREIFAQLMAAGADNKREAFRTAYMQNPKTHRIKDLSEQRFSELASRALQQADVNARIEELRLGGPAAVQAFPELQASVARKIQFTIEKAIHEADLIQREAMKAQQYGAATAALIAKAKLAGIWVERSESVNAHYAISDKPLSDEEWKRKYVVADTLN
jgi:hypothetical protein